MPFIIIKTRNPDKIIKPSDDDSLKTNTFTVPYLGFSGSEFLFLYF